MKCSECDKELCIYDGCHNEDCEQYEEDKICMYGDEWCEEEDFMEGLCECCMQELCVICGKCATPACEDEMCECIYV